MQANPGIGTNPDILGRLICPNGSVYDQTPVHKSATANIQLYGCIQCRIGNYHDVDAGKCLACVGRAFADADGATTCQYCPYSSDLDVVQQICLDFVCNGFCWMTISMGFGIPLMIFGAKFLLYTISTTIARQRKLNLAEQEQMTTWRMEQMMRQLGSTTPPNLTEQDDENANAALGPCRIYDLPKETQETVLETLQEHFQLRKQKMRVSLPEEELDKDGNENAPVDANEWDNVEWSTFHMHRILSRNYHGEVFLGDYCGTQVVVKRLMTLRFEVRELADAISDVELMLSFHHPQITRFLGTMWTEREHLCIISEYVKGGDLHSLLEMESMNHTAGGMAPYMNNSLHISGASRYTEDSFHTQFMTSSADSSSMMMTWWSTKLQMMLDVCKGLAHAHDTGVSHGDLRSRNVLVTELFQCKLNDFSHHTRSDKYATTTLRLQSEVSDDEDDDEDEEDEIDLDEVINPEGVQLMDAVPNTTSSRTNHRKKDDFFGHHRHYMLPLLPPEVLHHATRHLSSDVYGCGIMLIELWFYRHVSAVNITPSLQDEVMGGDDTLLGSTKLSVIDGSTDEQQRGTLDASNTANHTSSNHTNLADSMLSFSLDRAKMHSAMVHQFMTKLRLQSHLEPDESNDRSFGTTTTSSSAASVSFTSAAMLTEKLFTAIEECLHFDPKKRPTAKMLVKLFQQLLDDSSPRSC